MTIILHLGAHHCAAVEFRQAVEAARLTASGPSLWGPRRWRTLTRGAQGAPGQVARRVRGALADLPRPAGQPRRLIISDSGLLGAPQDCLAVGRLYPRVAVRMARTRALVGAVSQILLAIRPLEDWWAATLAEGAARSEGLPDPALCDRLAHAPRAWRHVIEDLAEACPEAMICVAPAEGIADSPTLWLGRLAGGAVTGAAPARPSIGPADDPVAPARLRWHAGPPETPLAHKAGQQGPGLPWRPFSNAGRAQLRAAYAADLRWLREGADGIATFIEECAPHETGFNLPAAPQERGHSHDGIAQNLARGR